MIWTRAVSTPVTRLLNELLAAYGEFMLPRSAELRGELAFSPIPYGAPLLSLRECAERRAAALAARGASVLFSGGADSTLALVSILCSPARAKADVVALASDAAFEVTDPQLMAWATAMGCRFVHVDVSTVAAQIREHAPAVTGTHGDNLFLGDYAYGHNLVERVWDMTPIEMLSAVSRRRLPPAAWDYYAPLFAEMPQWMERSAPNCLWWIAFFGQWQWTHCYLAALQDLTPLGVTHEHFFDSPEFQRWMMQDAAIRAGRTRSTHKQQLKELIHEFCGAAFLIPDKTGDWDQVLGTGRTMREVQGIDNDWNITRVFHGAV